MRRNVTVKDLATLANVSIGTVDRVLNNRGNVSAEKEKAVKDAIKTLNYVPNKVAQSLARQKNTIKIGVTFPDVERFFWDKVKIGIKQAQDELANVGVEIIIKTTSSYNTKEQINALHELKSAGVQGICMVPHHYRKLNAIINKFAEEQIPINTFISDSPESKRIRYFGVDDTMSGAIAGKLLGLFMKGHGKIAIMAIHREVLCIDQRIDGFIEKLIKDFPAISIAKTYDISGGSHLYDYEMYQDDVYRFTRELILSDPGITGLYVSNSLTNYASRAVYDLNVADRVSVVGHETTEDTSELMLNDALNGLVCQNPKLEVYEAIKHLYNMLNTGNDFSDEHDLHTQYEPITIRIKENYE